MTGAEQRPTDSGCSRECAPLSACCPKSLVPCYDTSYQCLHASMLGSIGRLNSMERHRITVNRFGHSNRANKGGSRSSQSGTLARARLRTEGEPPDGFRYALRSARASRFLPPSWPSAVPTAPVPDLYLPISISSLAHSSATLLSGFSEQSPHQGNMQGRIHSALPWPSAGSVSLNHVFEGDAALSPRGRSGRESHEISERLRHLGWGWDAQPEGARESKQTGRGSWMKPVGDPRCWHAPTRSASG